jgi:hypothetical protein
MNIRTRQALASMTVLSLLMVVSPVTAQSASGGARLEGLMLGVDGKPVRGFSVLLIDEDGAVLSRAETAEDGMYRFRDLPAGAYGLGIESPEGLAAPVRSEPARLADGQLVRMDIKLMEPATGAGLAPGAEQKGLGIWWAGLTKKGKILTLVALGVIVTITFIAITDDEDEASPNEP